MASTTSHNPSSSVSYLTPPLNSQTLPLPYDVFLSFRGPDTRAKFVSHLYDKLDGYGIRTFRDKPELRTGEVISDSLKKAIRTSRTYIVVFSENYAHSSWCLDELVEIYNCYQNMNRLVIGVYYNIDPSVVRHQTGSFDKDFEKHKTRFAEEKVNKWRHTLKEVANFSGQPVSAERDESDIINEIVDVILREIKPKTLHVADYPFGLVSRVKDITTLLSSSTEGVIKFGIYGMGGVGKTTLAKALFNQLLQERRFKNSCFLAEVREASGRTNGLVSLQQQLIDDVLKSKKKVEVHNVEEGTIIIRERICSAKILILIDDIDNFKQYQPLVGPFASGSVVIITTRDEEILDKIKVEPKYRYNVNGLDDAESRVLFTQHAFRNAEPDNTLMVLFEDILLLSGRLPLALEVFGSYLFAKSEEGWKAYIKILQRNLNSTIQQKLIISLDALESDDPMLKKIFLDIACFFIGRKKEEVVKIMETYYFNVNHNFDILKKRCLLTVNDRDELGMHDLLRDMGRQVAHNKFPDDVGKHSRLWVSKDICYVLRKEKGTKLIEGIIPSNFYYQDALEGVTFATKTFERMSNLRFLYLKNVKLSGSFEEIFDNLRWFGWECCPLECLPSNFCPQKLVILALRGSKMRRMWELNMNSQVFEKLTTLDMSYSVELTTTPDFSKFPCLETLNLKGCKSLEEVHISIGYLVRLVSLNLGDCVNLRSLPDSICNLKALNSLNIYGCSTLLGSLTEVNAWGITVWRLPNSIGRLSKLVELNPRKSFQFRESPASYSLYSTPTRWDVFLCFRGIDTQDAFPNRLCEALRRLVFISVYMDNPEVRSRGKVISHILPRAIEESKTFVVVFSEDYASSDRCLDELVEILNCHKTTERLVIPVFYHINSSDVQNQTGSFTEAFEKHQVCFEMEKVIKWRLALKEVAGYSGYHISQNRSEVDIIAKIAYEILYKTESQILRVAKYPVGLDSRVKGITAMISSATEGVIKIGIYGMGGVGKTTLAKALYNQLLLGESFKGSCFLENVREISGALKGLVTLQEQLVNDVLKSTKKVEIHSVDQGTKLIGARICSTKILLVIDDLDDHKQFESLVGPFVSGSVVILTTRDEEILDKIEVETKYRYMVNALDDAQSLPLFSQHAFGDTKPNNTLMVLCKDILRHAGGLPLALVVFGSYLCTKRSEVGWKSYIERLQRVPDNTIQQKLMISFDALEHDEKKIFLDIACFFIGWKKKDVVKILGTCYSFVDRRIDRLKKRCLLTINSRDELGMHNLLQDMGRKVARNNCYDEPGKHSRLWVLEDIFYVLKNHRGTKAIEGIIPHYLGHRDLLEGVSFDAGTFRRMSKLRFLYLKNVNLIGSFEQIFKGLRFIRWECCPWKVLPSDFHPQKLVILELPHSKMTTMREQNMVSEVFDELTTLDMSYSLDLTTTPDFTKFPCLKTLNLEGCKSLEEVHISARSLLWLVSLNLKYCCNVTSLSNLKQLKFLDISHCSALSEIQGLEELTSLRELHLGGCKSSLLAYSLTKHFFQIYSGFGHEIKIYIQAVEFPDWIRHSPDWIGQSSDLGSMMSFDLPPNVSHNFLAMILCFKHGVVTYDKTIYTVKNTTSGFIWSGSLQNNYPEAQIIIVPSSIFSVEDGDEGIELIANAEILGIHLLHKTEITMIDQSDRANVNVEEERRWYPSKWLKLLWVRPFWHKLLICLCIYFWKKLKSMYYLFWPSWILYWVRRRLAQYKDNRKKRGKE